jgi:hypothetical protein
MTYFEVQWKTPWVARLWQILLQKSQIAGC